MRRLIILALVVIVGCATTNPPTDADWDKVFAQKEVADAMEVIRYEAVCNQFVYMHVMGEMISKAEKKKGNTVHQGILFSIGERFAQLINTDEVQQRALLEMFLMGHGGEPFEYCDNSVLKSCLETEGERMEKFREVMLKYMEATNAK